MDGVMHRSRTMIPPTPAGLQWGEQSGGRLERGPMAEMFCFLFVTGGFTDIYTTDTFQITYTWMQFIL